MLTCPRGDWWHPLFHHSLVLSRALSTSSPHLAVVDTFLPSVLPPSPSLCTTHSSRGTHNPSACSGATNARRMPGVYSK